MGGGEGGREEREDYQTAYFHQAGDIYRVL